MPRFLNLFQNSKIYRAHNFRDSQRLLVGCRQGFKRRLRFGSKPRQERKASSHHSPDELPADEFRQGAHAQGPGILLNTGFSISKRNWPRRQLPNRIILK